MRYEIDQSGKIEQTNKPTIIAISNGLQKTIKISSVEKQKLIRLLTSSSFSRRTYVYDIFSVLIFKLFLLLPIHHVVIDKEYSGHEKEIKERLIQLCKKYSIAVPQIHFGLVGKASNSHKAAIEVLRRKNKPDYIITSNQVMEILLKKKDWRPRSGRGNP